MSNRQKSSRLILAGITLVLISAFTFATTWSGAPGWLSFGKVSAESPAEPVAEMLTPGTCDTAGPIEVEGTVLGTTPTAYATLTAAFAAINAGTHTGAISIDVCGDTNEATGTAVLNASGAGSASYTTINMIPGGGAARTISGATTAGNPMIDINGADNVTINGLNTGGNSLTISNTTVSAISGTSTIRFQTDATNNLITNASILGSATMAVGTNGGNIWFGSAAVTTGNDNNTISNSNIGPAGANLPSKAIYFSGSSNTDPGTANSGIVINNNNIFDYFNATVSTAGIDLNSGSVGTTISNNKFFQTATRTMTTTSLTHSAIRISNTSGNAYQITGNTIGFAAANGTGTYTIVTTATSPIIPINLSVGTTTATSIQGNTIAGIAISGASSGTSSTAAFRGIYVGSGLATAGDVTGNTVGSMSTTGSITYTSNSASTSDVIGIFNFGSSNWTTNNNNVGGITGSNSSTGATNIYGIRTNTGSGVTWICNNNTVGGTVANSINSTSTATGTIVNGILNNNPIGTFTGNIVRNMTVAGGTGTTTTASMVGILMSHTANDTISQNSIFNLSNSNATAATVVTGIQFNGSGTANVVERNLIHSLTTATNSASAEVNGIRVGAGTTVYRNNMIAIGAGIPNAIGAAATNSATTGVNGINEALGTDSFFHNSVYIGGAPTAGTGASYAFNGSQTVNTRSFRDNIFFNARSNSGATGKNYAVKINGTAPNPTGLTINNNLYFTNGTGAVFGFFNSLDVPDLATWKTSVGQDAASIFGNPAYNDPTNAVPDIHIHPTNPTLAEANGADVGVTNDFDGQTRSGLTPVDIGADAGNFNGVDVAAPIISYTAFLNTSSTANRNLVVTITDVTGVATGGNAPRIYYNKNAGSYVSQACSLASGTVNNGTWNCLIDYAAVGGVVVTDVIRYFVVAQDTVGNLAANPSAGFTGTNVNTVTTPPTTPNQYAITGSLGGSLNVGTGETYTSLTNVGGLFEAINNNAVTSNITANITTDLTAETGAVGLNVFAPGFGLVIKPSGAARVISGTSVGALIKFNGASNVTIDGSTSGGTDRSLTITQLGVTSPSVILFGSVGTTPITNGTLKNCIVINGANTSSAVVISDATTLGNAGFFSNMTIQNNSVQKAFVGVFATGGTTPQGGSNLTYTQNNVDTSGANAVRDVALYMQGVNGATVTNNTVGNIDTVNDENDVGIWLATGTINATVTGNTISNVGYTGTGAFAAIGLNITSSVASTNNLIANNTISNIATSGSTQVRGLVVGGATSDLTIERNNVSGVINTNTGTFGAYGMDISGGNNIVVRNNFVSNVTGDMTGGTAFSTTFGLFGIRVGAGNNISVLHNSVNLYGARTGTATTSLLTAAFALVGTTSLNCDVRNNIFANNITGGTTSIANVSAYLPSGGTSAMNLTWNNNSYYFGTDAARAGAGQAGTTAGTNFFTTKALLQAYSATLSAGGTNDNASISSTGAVPFVSNTDLHLTGGALEQAAGTLIASIPADIDTDLRDNAPDIGADEIPLTGRTGAIPAGTYRDGYLGAATLSGNVDFTGVLNLTGQINTGANTLGITCTGSVAGAGPNNYVIGNTRRDFCASGSYLFPVGTTPNGSALTGEGEGEGVADPEGTIGEYSPMTATLNAGTTFPSSLTVNVVDTWLPGLGQTSSISRYWNVTETGNVNTDMLFQYLPEDVYGDEPNYKPFKWDGVNTTQQPGSINAPANTFTATGVTNFSGWAAGVRVINAANASISGRVTTAGGNGIRNATVRLTGGRLTEPIVIQTGAFGIYHFDGLEVGQTYVLEVGAKRFRFSNPSQVIALQDDLTDVDFVANPNE